MNLEINKIPQTNSKEVSLDTELFEMNQNKMHRETGRFASLSIHDGETTWVITDISLVPDAINAVIDKLWIMHNAAFDLFHLRRWANVPERTGHDLWDTMIWERLLYNGYYERFSLEHLARRYLNIDFQKDIRKLFETHTSMSPSMIEYSGKDAQYTYDIKQEQKKIAQDQSYYNDLTLLWIDIEAPMIENMLDFKGFCLDVQEWENLAKLHMAISDDVKEALKFNPASPQQVRKALLERGINVPNTRADTLEDYKDEDIVSRVLSFRKAAKLAGTYGLKFLDKYLEPDGKIYSNYISVGASTGRSASRKPNMQNIPNDSAFRKSFIASPGNKLIISDYSQQEVRITAFHSEDENLRKILKQGGDTHLATARLIFDDDNIQKGDPERFIGKTINLAIVYGLTAYNLASRMNTYYSKKGIDKEMSVDEAQAMIDGYFRAFPGVKEFIDHQRWLANRYHYVTTQMGRVCWVNPYNKQWLNNAINSPIQGGAADQMKLALIKLRNACKKLGLNYPVVAMVHDEIVLDVPEEQIEQYKNLVVAAMNNAGKELYPGVVWKVDPIIADTWAGKK